MYLRFSVYSKAIWFLSASALTLVAATAHASTSRSSGGTLDKTLGKHASNPKHMLNMALDSSIKEHQKIERSYLEGASAENPSSNAATDNRQIELSDASNEGASRHRVFGRLPKRLKSDQRSRSRIQKTAEYQPLLSE